MAPAMAYDTEGQIRDQLLDRRQRLHAVIADAPDAAPLAQLLEEVDATLARLEHGTFGLCDLCHDPIESTRIHADPLARTCLDCLTATEQRALERDLDLAGHVQRRLLPPAALRVDGWEAGYHYQPAGSASGDFVDLIPLESGELIFLNTDGITETLDAVGREYGQERLVRAIGGRHSVPIADLMSSCLTDLARFRGDGRRGDDLTLFALRRW